MRRQSGLGFWVDKCVLCFSLGAVVLLKYRGVPEKGLLRGVGGRGTMPAPDGVSVTRCFILSPVKFVTWCLTRCAVFYFFCTRVTLVTSAWSVICRCKQLLGNTNNLHIILTFKFLFSTFYFSVPFSKPCAPPPPPFPYRVKKLFIIIIY